MALASVRAQAEKTRPPRALWTAGSTRPAVGRTRVIRRSSCASCGCLALLERTDGPVILEDFPEDPPGLTDKAGWTMPGITPVHRLRRRQSGRRRLPRTSQMLPFWQAAQRGSVGVRWGSAFRCQRTGQRLQGLLDGALPLVPELETTAYRSASCATTSKHSMARRLRRSDRSHLLGKSTPGFGGRPWRAKCCRLSVPWPWAARITVSELSVVKLLCRLLGWARQNRPHCAQGFPSFPSGASCGLFRRTDNQVVLGDIKCAGHMGVCDGSSYQDERRTDQPYGPREAPPIADEGLVAHLCKRRTSEHLHQTAPRAINEIITLRWDLATGDGQCDRLVGHSTLDSLRPSRAGASRPTRLPR